MPADGRQSLPEPESFTAKNVQKKTIAWVEDFYGSGKTAQVPVGGNKLHKTKK
jgi:hypothetical protein